MQSLVQNLKTLVAQSQGAVTATGNSTIVIDRQGFNAAMFVIMASTVGATDTSNYLKVVIQEGDASDGSDMASITDTSRYIYNDYANPTQNMTALVADGVFKIGVILGTKRYLRLRLEETGTANVTLTALAILGHPSHSPVIQ